MTRMDKEKVNKGLHQHCEGSMFDRCEECPYYDVADEPFICRDMLLNDLNALQKEKEHEVCENCPYKLEDIGDFSDGYHTFNDLYTQRAVLFATIVNQNLDKAWKSRKHEDGEPCFGGGWFIVAVDTPKGSYSYHYEDKYWDIFKCVELPVAKHWDGHTDKDVWRLLLL